MYVPRTKALALLWFCCCFYVSWMVFEIASDSTSAAMGLMGIAFGVILLVGAFLGLLVIILHASGFSLFSLVASPWASPSSADSSRGGLPPRTLVLRIALLLRSVPYRERILPRLDPTGL